jgi:hypothetical protein
MLTNSPRSLCRGVMSIHAFALALKPQERRVEGVPLKIPIDIRFGDSYTDENRYQYYADDDATPGPSSWKPFTRSSPTIESSRDTSFSIRVLPSKVSGRLT